MIFAEAAPQCAWRNGRARMGRRRR